MRNFRVTEILTRKPRWERWVFARFIFSLVFLLCFFIAKILRFKSKQKSQSCEKKLGQLHSGLFLCIFFVFVQVFCRPKPNCPRTRGKPKKQKNKKNTSVRRILGKSIQDCFFCLFGFFRGFLLSQAQLSKNSRKTKKKTKQNKKNNPVRRILGKSIQDCFFGLFGFSRGLCCPKPNCPKTRGNRIIYVERHKAFFTQPIIQLSI